MRKFYFLTIAMLATIAATAANPASVRKAKKESNQGNSIENLVAAKSHDFKAAMAAKNASKAKSRSQIESGEHIYELNTTRFVYSYNLIYENVDCAAELIFDDEYVYFTNIISSLNDCEWIEGTLIDENTIRVDLPQVCIVDTEYGETTEFLASKMQYTTYERDGKTYMTYMSVEPEDNYVIYKINDDGSIKLMLNDGDPYNTLTPPEYIIGVCVDDTPGVNDWYGVGDAYQEYMPIGGEFVSVPEGVEVETWALLTNEYNNTIGVAFDGDDVYFTDFADYLDMTFKGKVEGDKIVIETPQMLGIFDGYLLYLMACEWASDEWEDYDMLESVTLNYDAEAKVISADNPMLDILINLNDYDYNPIDYMSDPTIVYQSEEDTYAAPEDPYVEYFEPYEYRDWLGDSEGYIEWIIPNVNVNGFVLSTSNMYYNFLINGEVVTFTTDEYPFFDQDYTDIPYDYEEGYDLQVFDESHYITFKQADATSFGLQSFYVGANGSTYASNLVTYIPGHDGVEVGGISSKEVVKVEFFDMQGRRVVNPEAGLYVVRSTFADGSVDVKKMHRR